MKDFEFRGNIDNIITALKAIRSQHRTIVEFLDRVDFLKGAYTLENYTSGLMLDEREVR